MDKESILSTITTMSSQNLLTKDEVVSAYERGKDKKVGSLTREVGISEVLYFIGGFIVFIGIAILVFQNWNSLNAFTKILVTLGFGIASYIVGVLFNKEEKYGAVGLAFHLIAALVIPLGLNIAFDQAGFDPGYPFMQSLITGIVFIMYLISFFVFKKTIFTLFSIMYATWFFFNFTNFLIGPNPYFTNMKFHEYRFLFVGLSYLFLGYYFSFTEQKALTEPLYSFGTLFFLGAALVLGGWQPSQNIFWELAFPLIVFSILLLSVKLKSKAFLTWGTIFLMLYILKITGEYFSGTLGWPLSLMVAGISLIGVGYYAFTMKKKYLS